VELALGIAALGGAVVCTSIATVILAPDSRHAAAQACLGGTC
jgi:hypothetical protein